MQGICDNRGRFQDVFTGTPSKIHDARVLRLSSVNEDLSRICEGKYHILGDAAYPIREHLLTPYKNYGSMTQRQSTYNYRHSATRVIIENAFGLLKQRFRQLRYIELTSVDKISEFIMACCVLHNLCLDAGDTAVDDILCDDDQGQQWDVTPCDSQQEVEFNEPRQTRPDTREAALRQLGECKRDELADKFTAR